MMFQGIRLGYLNIVKQLSRGAEAKVLLVTDEFKQKYAVKAYIDDPSRHMKNEIMMHRRLGDHVNISAPIDDAIRIRKKTPMHGTLPSALVFKYYESGDMADYYEEQRYEYTEETLIESMIGLWRGLEHCHKNDVCHRDIKPQNILYDKESDSVLLSDFGLSCDSTNITSAGTSLYYSAPECFGRHRHPPYDYKCDVWSAGATFLTMLSGSHILEENHGHNIRRHGCRYIKKHFKKGWNGLSRTSQDILKSTLIPDPRDRCEAHDVLKILA